MTRASGAPRSRLHSDRWRRLAEVSELYYHEGRTQEDVARRLGISRVMVSRLLAEAAREGVIEFKIHWESPRNHALEDSLMQAFPGCTAVVVDAAEGSLDEQTGRLAAAIAQASLTDGAVLAISYGRAVHETIRAIPIHHFSTVEVVQLAGVEGATNPEVDGWELVRLCADRLGGRYHYIPAGLYSSSNDVHQALLNDVRIAAVMERARTASLAIVGVGSMDPSTSSLVRAGHATARQLRESQDAGSVGYICGQHYDVSGNPLESMNAHTLSLPLSQLRDIPRVIGVAHGTHKALPLIGALRGSYVDTVVTDRAAAQAMLQVLADEGRRGRTATSASARRRNNPR